MDGLTHRHEEADVVAKERPELLMLCGVAGIIGTLGPMVAILVAWLVTDHDFIPDTVSDLARGPQKWIMDLGFYLHAAGLLGLAIASAHAHMGRAAWSVGIFCLAFLALNVVLLGLWDEFGATSDSSGMSMHVKLTFGLGPLFLAGPLLMAPGMRHAHAGFATLFVAAAAIWAVFAIAFKLAPDGFDGFLEKIAILGTMLWTIPLAVFYLARGWEQSHRLTGGSED